MFTKYNIKGKANTKLYNSKFLIESKDITKSFNIFYTYFIVIITSISYNKDLKISIL